MIVIGWAEKLFKPVAGIIQWLDRLAQTHPEIIKFALAFAFAAATSLFALGAMRMFTAGVFYSIGGVLRFISILGKVPLIFFAIRLYTAIAASAVWGFFTSASAAVWSFMATNPVGWVLLGISAIVMFALAWKNNWLGIGTFMNKVVAGIARGFMWLWNQITAGVNWIASLPDKLYDIGRKMANSFSDGINSAAMSPYNAVKGIVQKS